MLLTGRQFQFVHPWVFDGMGDVPTVFSSSYGHYNSEGLIAFLQDLKRHLRGKKGDPGMGRASCTQESDDERVLA